MVAAFNITQEARIPCMAHRCNTTIETAWSREDAKNPTFATFNLAVRELRKYTNQTSGIQDKLTKTLKGGCGTRPWRSYFTIHDSLNDSFEELNTILRDRQEQYRLFNIDPVLLNGIVQLMRPFSMILDKLEMANQPTLQNVVPSYYRMMNDTQINANDHKIIKELKSEIRYCLDEKYLPPILQIHWVDRSYLETQKNEVRKGLHILASNIIQQFDSSHSSQSQHVSSTSPSTSSKHIKNDPFADFRTKKSTQKSSIHDTNTFAKELDQQIQIYENMEVDDGYDNNPFTFWYSHKDDLSLLAKIAKSVLVIPASSAESERHFSMAGQIVTELRSSLDPEYVEALVKNILYLLITTRDVHRPTRNGTYIRFMDASTNTSVRVFDAGWASNILYYGNTSSIITSYSWIPGRSYYVLFDSGVVSGIEFCGSESAPIADPTFWTFNIWDPG
ncbi:unnamed protein product [Rotaria sp. Silwood1]|nr:unnamed protein product [Rotaria sp. Silwood1]CAF4975714.1 unnamed protein product [Rotaria sp. Silwood1]